MHSAPVWLAVTPEAETTPTWRCAGIRSAAKTASIATCGDCPLARASRMRGPKPANPIAWVATAPTPARAQGTTAPTARDLDCTATPTSPLVGSAATMEQAEVTVESLAGG